MAIPVSIEKLLNENIVEWARIEFKEGWNPDSTLKTISAFANDIDNWGGGYIVIGVKEENGKILKPITGLNEESVDHIQKEILKYCKYLKPNYVPQSEPVYYEGKMVLLIWCPGGYERPYQCPKRPTSKNSEKAYYIRKLSSTIEATDLDVKELIALTHNIPFDDRVNIKSELTDLKYPIIRNYLETVNSNLLNTLEHKRLEDLAKDLRIADGPKEYFKPLNVGLLFFNDNPETFFPYSRIELVNIPDPTGQGMEERIFTGPIDQQLRDVLSYLKNNVIAEKIFKLNGQAEAIRVKNYSYEALEEFISNAIYHKSYQLYEPITIRIEKEQIEITSIPGPDRSISDRDISNYNMRTRRYRNRRIGDFLKELHLVEGRNTGIPTAIKSIKENGSPMPKLLTDKERTFFSVIMPIHESFKQNGNMNIQEKKGRRTKNEIKVLILEVLEEKDLSATSIYRKLGYSGNLSKTFRKCIEELVLDSKIKYLEENINASNNLLTKIK
ncbi:RNA-binding domain-containing protein [Amedibacterium intestinale]|uniref:RNA-binding domain-containing protein n=1 Tax=Amedibacterium intestinale TaxID=2583452 RepID=UPI0039924BA8